MAESSLVCPERGDITDLLMFLGRGQALQGTTTAPAPSAKQGLPRVREQVPASGCRG